MKVLSIRAALQQVADYPEPLDDEVIQHRAHELVARALFEIANQPDAARRGSMARANKARAMILDRMVGRRRSGSHPATRNSSAVEFIDLTGKELPGAEEDD